MSFIIFVPSLISAGQPYRKVEIQHERAYTGVLVILQQTEDEPRDVIRDEGRGHADDCREQHV